MKCVRSRVNGGVCRIGDAEAVKLVERAGGMWEYAGKQEWKNKGRMTTIQAAEDFKESPMPKKLGKAALPVPVIENAGEMVGDEIAIVKKPKYKKGVSTKNGKKTKNVEK